jgi:Putative phage metallopeptidase
VMLLLVVTACAPNHETQVNVPSALQPYVARFQQTGQDVTGEEIVITDLVVKFQQGNLDGGDESGVCATSPYTSPTITIAEGDWMGMSEEQREILMFHELGHCVLHRAHLNSLISILVAGGQTENVPESIMYFSAPSQLTEGDVYETNHDQYMKELFTVTEPSL